MTPDTRPFDSEAGYRAAIEQTFTLAQRELRIFDRDLLNMALDVRTRVAMLAAFLAADAARRLMVIVHDSAPLASRQPRLLALLRDHAHQVDVRVTPENLRHLSDCWVLADQEHGSIRFHADHARGKLLVSAKAEIRPWWQRADDLLAESTPDTPWSVVGL